MRGEPPLECRDYGSKEDASFQIIVLVSASNHRRSSTAAPEISLYAEKPIIPHQI
jgi:hypothetical protein